ncbi:MAG TPA: bifunctional 5,10-methylenetetrahydrofolate dehydrogenase/5,10-methenyltetrahydrofolate cyclohydrolase [Thermoanaerobaculia bacterium]
MPENSSARLLDGTSVARTLRERLRTQVQEVSRLGAPPFLRVILVGEDPASMTYVSSKSRAAEEAGCLAETVRLPGMTAPERLLKEVERANRDDAVDGILVQLPLPPGHDARMVFDTIDPSKDVDGLHPENVGLLVQGRPRFVPCTAAGILALLDAYEIPIEGANAVVLGRSEIVGKPVAALLTSRNSTVTVCHSKTKALSAVCRRADILVAAIGRPGFVTRDFVREGAVVVDVGINRLETIEQAPEHLKLSPRLRDAIARRGRALVGDVDFDGVCRVASWITPVPGGVGPLTIAMLLQNTVDAARRRREGHMLGNQDCV